MIGIALSPAVVRHRDGCGTSGGVSCNVTPFINEVVDPAVSASLSGSTQLAGSISGSDREAHDVERGVSLIRDGSDQAETGGSGEIVRHLDIHLHRHQFVVRWPQHGGFGGTCYVRRRRINFARRGAMV